MTITHINNGESGASARGKINALVDAATERGTMLTQVGVDCTGATDATAELQAAFDALPDDAYLVAPQGTLLKLSDPGIILTDRAGIGLISDIRNKNQSVTPQIIWDGSDGTMFTFTTCDHPLIAGFLFNGASGSGCPDSFIVFDGEGGAKTPTQAKVANCSFLADAGHTAHKAIQISPTANSNHEDYEIIDCDFNGYGAADATVRRATDGVTTNSSTTLTSASATFVTGDVGKKIIISCALGSLTTTIASRTNGTTVVLTDAWTLSSQTGCTIHIGTRYGTAIYQRGSNSFATRFTNITVHDYAIGLDLGGGSNGKITNLGGGFNDLGILMDGGWDIDRMDSESNVRAMEILAVNRPNIITGSRYDISAARADGWILLDTVANLTIIGGYIDGTPATNSLLVGNYGGQGNIVSVNNYYYPCTHAQVQTNVTNWVSIQDKFSDGGAAVKTIFNNLPTSQPSTTGQVWLDGSVLTIGAGGGGGDSEIISLTQTDKGTVTSGTVTFDASVATKQKLTVGGNLTIAYSNWPASGVYGEVEVQLVNGGAHTITWPSVNWVLGDGTTSATFADMGVTLQASGTNHVLTWTADGGATVYGRAA